MRRALPLLLAAAGACSGAGERPGDEVRGSGLAAVPSEAAAPPQAAADTSIAALLSRTFGGGVLLHDAAPAVLRGDLNGDGAEDLVAVVVHGAGRLAGGVTRVHPWPSDEGATDDLAAGSRARVAVIHGGSARRAFLIHDPNPVSILDAGAAKEISILPRARLAAEGGDELAEAARGDVVVVPTEAGIDTYLYWDGSTYQAYEPMEMP